MTYCRLVALVALTLAPVASQAAEVQFEGYYRARFRAYDTLSLNRDLANSEGLAAYAQHRLWLRPKFLLDENVAVIADIRGLDGVAWGVDPGSLTDPATQALVPLELTDGLQPPTGEGTRLLDISLWRIWGEFDTGIGRFSFGRQPLHWGVGMWQNDGLGWNADYGDTTDRVAWEETFDDIWVRAAVDINAEGLVGEEDDTTSFNAAVGYRTELVTAGIQTQLRRTPARDFNLFTADAALEAEIGTLDVRGEGIGQFGGGDLADGTVGAQIQGIGAVLDISLTTDPWVFELEGGFASGDGDDTDQIYKTFAFDRDYNVGIVMFEQAMPLLASIGGTEEGLDDGGRDLSATLSGNSVSNAFYVRPRVSRGIIDGLDVEASVLFARTAALPERFTNRNTYGIEGNLGARYEPIEHVELGLTLGLFLPGSFYSGYSDDLYSGFDDPVFAGQIIGQVNF